MKSGVPKRVVPSVRASNGFSALGLSNTVLGDRVEAALVRLPGWKALHTTYRQGAFDVEGPDGVWYEVKACSVFASEYKAKPKAHEIRSKMNALARASREGGMIIAVVDEKLRAWIYRRPGLGAFRLPSDGRGWEFVGRVKL